MVFHSARVLWKDPRAFGKQQVQSSVLAGGQPRSSAVRAAASDGNSRKGCGALVVTTCLGVWVATAASYFSQLHRKCHGFFYDHE